jgi:hypothetical protein
MKEPSHRPCLIDFSKSPPIRTESVTYPVGRLTLRKGETLYCKYCDSDRDHRNWWLMPRGEYDSVVSDIFTRGTEFLLCGRCEHVSAFDLTSS